MNIPVFSRDVFECLEHKGYSLNKSPYRLTFIGIRATVQNTNNFNDMVCAVMFDQSGDVLHWHTWDATTDPGLYFMENPMNSRGTAIVKTGLYRNLWYMDFARVNKHLFWKNGILVDLMTGVQAARRYVAKQKHIFRQLRELVVYRDNNRDHKLDLANPQSGKYFINFHTTHKYLWTPDVVNRWSAGCQVVRYQAHYCHAVWLGMKQYFMSPDRSNTFDYILIDEADLEPFLDDNINIATLNSARKDDRFTQST